MDGVIGRGRREAGGDGGARRVLSLLFVLIFLT